MCYIFKIQQPSFLPIPLRPENDYIITYINTYMDTYERKKLPVSRFKVHIVTIFLLFNTVVVYFCFMFTLQTSCKWLNHIHCQLGYFVILCHVTVVSFYYSLSLYIFCSCCNFIVLFLNFFLVVSFQVCICLCFYWWFCFVFLSLSV